MGNRMNKHGYQQLIAENLRWLEMQPRTLERDHVVLVLNWSVGVLYPEPEVEQNAFEAWAKSQDYDLGMHPIHYLFLDKETYAARQGWKAALDFTSSGDVLKAIPPVPSYVPQELALEMFAMLQAAGFGQEGEANTLHGMLMVALEELEQLRGKNRV